MNKRALIFGVIYSVIVVIYKLAIIFTGQQLTTFGFYYSHIISVFAIIPFMIIAVKQVRDIDYGGLISGKEALKVGLTVFAIAVVILSMYTYIEFEWKLRDISVQYYNGPEYHQFLEKQSASNPTKVNKSMYQDIIDSNIADLSPMKAVTAKLFSFFILCFSFSFIVAVFMKRSTLAR
jgi:hypothetical protein